MSDYNDKNLTVTIPLDEYRDLIDTQARVSILRTNMISDLRACLDYQAKNNCFGSYYGVDNCKIEWEKISNILGFLPTFNGFYEEEKKLAEECENEEQN